MRTPKQKHSLRILPKRRQMQTPKACLQPHWLLNPLTSSYSNWTKKTFIYLLLGIGLFLITVIIVFIGVKMYIKRRRTSVGPMSNTSTSTRANPIYRDPNVGSMSNLITNTSMSDSDSNITITSTQLQESISMSTIISNESQQSIPNISMISETSM